MPFVDFEKAGPDNADGPSSHLRVLAAHFSTLVSLSDAEMAVLRDLAETARYHPQYRDLYAAEAMAPPPRLIVAGWAAQYGLLPDGQRQITSLRLPGDLIGSLTQLRLPASCAVAALTGLETVSAQLLVEATAAANPIHPNLAHAARVMSYWDDRLLCNQIVRLGRQTACSRFAHLMLELRERLDRVGQVENDCFAMPLTQDVLADVLGFSVVHVNRTVQQLRRDGLLDVRNGMVTLIRLKQLQILAGWTAQPSRSVDYGRTAIKVVPSGWTGWWPS